MVSVKVEKQCGCFKRSDFELEQSFETMEVAKQKAQKMCDQMNEEFCLKHQFEVLPVSEHEIIIKMYLRENI